MNDEIQPQPTPEQPIQPKINKKVQNRRVLEKLPAEIRGEMDDYIRAQNPGAARKYMQEKYGEQFPALKDLGRAAFYLYAKKYNVKLMKEIALQTEVANTPPELLRVIENIADTSISIDDKKAALTSLYNDCAATSKKLEATQTNFLDPQIQMVILQNRKQMCTIIEKLSVLSEQLSKDSDKNWLAEAEEIMQVFISAVVNSYKIVHQDQSLFSKFMADYLDRITGLMAAYRATKETLKKEPVKIS